MKIVSWSIDGFGVFRDHAGPELPDGITVLHGPNEAGKSTLLAFIRGVLFGFKDRRSGTVYEAPTGALHGGRLVLQSDGRLLTVDRQAGRRNAPPHVTYGDGEPGTPGDLLRMLGNADKALFESIFAFSLAELQAFSSLSDEGVAERIFSAGLTGAGLSARRALTATEQRAAEIFRKTARQDKLRTALAAYDRAQADLSTARHLAGEYARRQDEERAAEQDLQELQRQVEAQREEVRRVTDLLELWPPWQALVEAQAAADSFPSLPPLAVESLAELVRTLELQRDRLERQPRLHASLRVAREQADAALADLGPAWTEERLAALDTSIPAREAIRSCQQQLEKAASATQAAAIALDRARDELRQREQDLAEFQRTMPTEEPPPEHELRAHTRLCAQLRADLSDLRVARAARRGSGGLTLTLATVIPTLFIVALGVWRLASGDPLLGTLLVAAGTVGGIVVATQRMRAAPAPSACRDLEQRVAAACERLSLPAEPPTHEVEQRDAALRDALARRAEYDRLATELHLRAERLRIRREETAPLHETYRQAVDAAARAAAAWKEHRSAAGLPEQLSPAGALDFLRAAEAARDKLAAVAEAHGQLSALENARRAWEQQATSALQQADQVWTAAPPSGEQLLARVSALHETVERRQEALRRVAAARAVVEGRLGCDSAAQAELATGRLSEWQTRADHLATSLGEADQQLAAAAKRCRDAETARRHIEASADVPAAAAAVQAVTQDLRTLAHSWRALTLAGALVSRTLASFTEHHQPRVLARASSLFAHVTQGRYVRIVQEGLPQQLAVVDDHGARKTTVQLSRGTAEQLYLCVRLALAEEFGARAARLPLVMDEVLVNFDPQRARALCRVLGTLAPDQQVLLFTCHPGTRDMLREELGDAVACVELAGRDVSFEPASQPSPHPKRKGAVR